jgi:hypothetical protein
MLVSPMSPVSETGVEMRQVMKNRIVAVGGLFALLRYVLLSTFFSLFFLPGEAR